VVAVMTLRVRTGGRSDNRRPAMCDAVLLVLGDPHARRRARPSRPVARPAGGASDAGAGARATAGPRRRRAQRLAGTRWCAEYCDAAASRSAESTAPVHGRLGAPYCAPVFLLCFGGDRTDRAGAGAAQRAIAAHLAIPCCDRIMGQRGMSTCVAYLHRGVVVSGSRRLHIEPGRHNNYLTSAAPPRGSSFPLARHLGEVRMDQDHPDYAGTRRVG
jgi:hypothetical protein